MVVLVTGISRGLGLEITSVLLNEGNTVYGISRSMSPALQDLMSKYPNTLKWKSFSLDEPHEIKESLFKDWIGYGVSIDGFVNNAAVAYDDIVTNMDIDRLDEMYRVNVYSPMLMTKYVIRNMLLHNKKGSIVHISSISVHTGYKGLAMYASTKGALEAFSKNVAREWGRLSIRSNCIVSGFMQTEMSSSLTNEQLQKIFSRTSLKRATDIRSVAETCAFLLSQGAESITGQNIHVDAGTI
jgi:3-oxoacyl-[acyl-carrier protein] reductase